MAEQKPVRVLITVNGGVVEIVGADADTPVEMTVVDYDNIKGADGDRDAIEAIFEPETVSAMSAEDFDAGIETMREDALTEYGVEARPDEPTPG